MLAGRARELRQALGSRSFIDQVPSEKNHPGYPFQTAKLGEQ